MPMKIADVIRALQAKDKKRWTQSNIAAATGQQQGTISRVLTGRIENPGEDFVLAINTLAASEGLPVSQEAAQTVFDGLSPENRALVESLARKLAEQERLERLLAEQQATAPAKSPQND